MTPTTRSTNRDADYTKYYPKKKAPKQKYFPARRKTVRTKQTHRNHSGGSEPRQLRITEVGKRRNNVVENSDNEEEEEDEHLERTSSSSNRRGTAPNYYYVEEVEGGNADRLAHGGIKREPLTDDEEAQVQHSESESPDEGPSSPPPRRRRPKRQSTMTQLVNGTTPLPGAPEPGFRPAKRARKSYGSRSVDRGRQNTLTQMVPGMRLSFADSEDEEEEKDNGAEEDGWLIGGAEGMEDAPYEQMTHEAPVHSYKSPNRPSSNQVAQTSKRPTQPRRSSSKENISPQKIDTPHFRQLGLSTPRKRILRVIPSSQSPAESVLSTQNTPQKDKSPLQGRSRGKSDVFATPSKLRHVMALQTPIQAPAVPRLHRIRSEIPDSDEEEERELETQAPFGPRGDTNDMPLMPPETRDFAFNINIDGENDHPRSSSAPTEGAIEPVAPAESIVQETLVDPGNNEPESDLETDGETQESYHTASSRHRIAPTPHNEEEPFSSIIQLSDSSPPRERNLPRAIPPTPPPLGVAEPQASTFDMQDSVDLDGAPIEMRSGIISNLPPLSSFWTRRPPPPPPFDPKHKQEEPPLSSGTTISYEPSPQTTPRPLRQSNPTPRPRRRIAQIPDSHPPSSPTAPPPLVIPSSPSPVAQRRWTNLSSPVAARYHRAGDQETQRVQETLEVVEESLLVDDFSIPPLPPGWKGWNASED